MKALFFRSLPVVSFVLAIATAQAQTTYDIEKASLDHDPISVQKEEKKPTVKAEPSVNAIQNAIENYHQGRYEGVAEVLSSAEALKDASANYYLANMFALGLGVEQDYPTAHDLYVEAARRYHVDAMFSLGIMYARGLGVKKNYPVAVEWYQEAAKHNHAKAMFNLANLHMIGLGVEQNDAQAKEWYEKAAYVGDARAMCNLGNLYRYGYGVPINFSTAKEWYERGAQKTDECSLLNLAWFYFRGWSVDQNLKQALELDKTGALMGNPVAAFNLARMYHYGMGTPENLGQAWYWYQKSANSYYLPAMEQIAVIYEQGLLGKEMSEEKAKEWKEKIENVKTTYLKPHDPFSAASYKLEDNIKIVPKMN